MMIVRQAMMSMSRMMRILDERHAPSENLPIMIPNCCHKRYCLKMVQQIDAQTCLLHPSLVVFDV